MQLATEAARDEEVREALGFEYAGRIMAQSWQSNFGGSPADEWIHKMNRSVERASALGIGITNIMSLWGSKAIVNLAAFAKDFRERSP